jgi:hypothetical protein
MMKAAKALCISVALLPCAHKAGAQGAVVVTSAPTLEFMGYESKIESAQSFAEQLVHLKQMIEEARRQVAKMDSAKRGIEKTYQLQENIRKDVVSSYNAVRSMNIHNLAHITEGYLGFSINPKDHLPNMPGMEGYSDFRRSLEYDPADNIAPNTRQLDNFLSSLTLDYSDSLVQLAMNDPNYSYLLELQKIQNLTSAYHGYTTHTRLHRLATVTLPRHKAALETYKSMADSAKTSAEIIAANVQMQAAANQIDEDLREIDALTEELIGEAAYAAQVRDIARRRQGELIALVSGIATSYSVNRNQHSLRRMAAARKPRDSEALKKTREAIDRKPTGALAPARSQSRRMAGANPLGQAIAAMQAYANGWRRPKAEVAKVDTFIFDAETGRVLKSPSNQ